MQYINSLTNEIIYDYTLEGLEGEDYSITYEEKENYVLTKQEGETSGTYTKDIIYVKYYLEQYAYNIESYQLPTTGSIGTMYFYIIGACIVILGAKIKIFSKKSNFKI